jgi:tRNA G10  N-methylase Trm11
MKRCKEYRFAVVKASWFMARGFIARKRPSFIQPSAIWKTILIKDKVFYMKYFFVLGSNPAASAAEIIACTKNIGLTINEISQQILIAKSEREIDVTALMSRLGGTIKIGQLTEHQSPPDVDMMTKVLTQELILRAKEGKIKFGYSIYSLDKEPTKFEIKKMMDKLRRVGMETKRQLRERKLSARWIKSKTDDVLTSVVVEKENLISNGAEFCFLIKKQKLLMGLTKIVQPFNLFSRIDFGRPNRDAYRGMLPPKIARIMLNLAGIKDNMTIWDPFCGSGTVITEALLMGASSIFGSDLDPKAVSDTKQNIDWLIKNGFIQQAKKTHIFTHDARKQPKIIAPDSIKAVVSEPFLGPPRQGHESKKELTRRLAELTNLYRSALLTWRPLLSSEAVLILALPLYKVGSEKLGVNLTTIIGKTYKVDPILPTPMTNFFHQGITPGGGIIYGRPNQLVWREIIKLSI